MIETAATDDASIIFAGFNLVIEILIIDRIRKGNSGRLSLSFNLVIEILIIDREAAAIGDQHLQDMFQSRNRDSYH